MSNTILGLMIVTTLSTFTGWFFSHRKEAEMPVKVMIFVLYFWGAVFIQLMIFAGLYHFELLGLFKQ